MKFAILSFILVLYFSTAFSQKAPKNPFVDITESLPKNKPTIIYIFASWCSATVESYITVVDTLLANKSKVNFIIFYDTTGSLYNTITNKKLFSRADKLIDIADYYPSRFKKLSDNKKITSHFNEVFQTSIFRLGPSSMLLINANKEFVTALSPFESQKELSKILKEY